MPFGTSRQPSVLSSDICYRTNGAAKCYKISERRSIASVLAAYVNLHLSAGFDSLLLCLSQRLEQPNSDSKGNGSG
jgi:hypothetical protein